MDDKLIPIEFKSQRIMTTKVLANSFGTEDRRISENFNGNQKRFIENKHYFLLVGEDLKAFKREYAENVVAQNVNKLYLWTDRGAARHAKILETDEAWEVYEDLEDNYFETKGNIQSDAMKLFDARLEQLAKLTEQASLQYKPSHKTKLRYDKVIKSVTNNKDEYDSVKAWVFCTLGISKWEDTCVEDSTRIMEIITAASTLISIKKIEQLKLF